MAEITTQDELNAYMSKQLREELSNHYGKFEDVKSIFDTYHQTTSNGILNRCVDLANNLNALKAASLSIEFEEIDKSTLLSEKNYDVYRLKSGSKILDIKTKIPDSFGFNYILGYAPSASPEINAPSILNYMYSINTDEIFKFSGKETLHEIFNLDFESYLRYYDEIEELFDKLKSLRVSVNKVSKFRISYDSPNNINTFIEKVEVIQTNNEVENNDFNILLDQLICNIENPNIVYDGHEVIEKSEAEDLACNTLYDEYASAFFNVTRECGNLIEKLEGMKSIREDFVEYYPRIKVLNTMIGDVAYDLNKVASDLESIPFTDASSYVDSVRAVVVSNYSESGEVNTEVLNETTIFTDEEKLKMTERLYLDIMIDLGLMGDIDPAGRIVITSENYEDYIVDGEFDINQVVEILALSNGEEYYDYELGMDAQKVVDSYTFSGTDIENALSMYMEGYTNKYPDHIGAKEWNEILKSYQMVIDYNEALSLGHVIVDIDLTKKGYDFYVKTKLKVEKNINTSMFGDLTDYWGAVPHSYEYIHSKERNTISDTFADILKKISLDYLEDKLKEINGDETVTVVSFVVTESSVKILEKFLSAPPVVGDMISIALLMSELEKNGIEEAEVLKIIDQIEALDDVKFMSLDNMEQFEFSIILSLSENGQSVISIIPNAMTIQMQNAASDITIVLNSEVGSPEYNQAMDRLYQMHKDNKGGGDYSDFLTMSSLRTYQTQIEELSNMTPQEIVENYDDYEKALTNIKTAIGL